MTSAINPKAVYFPKRLADDLENIKNYPLTVLEAPSGFGKTTALEFFFGKEEFESTYILKHTFFSADASEYWQWLCKVLTGIDRISAEALKGIRMPCGENMADIREIMGDLECSEDTYIIFDNLNASENDIKWFLTALSCSTASKLHFVLSVQTAGTNSRIDIAGGGKAYFIDADDFAFSKDDCRAYFALAGMVLTESETAELYKITGGWIFAIYLQLLFYIKNKRFERGILNNWIEKAFFGRLSDEEKKFYLSLSPLKSFTLGQAAEISGKDIDFVQAHICGGGFVHYDSKKNVYYFHNLLHDYLREAFSCLGKEEKQGYYLAAAKWEENRGEKINAISLYYKAGAYEKIFSMPHTSYDLSDIGDVNTRKMIFDILDQTPHEVKLEHCESMIPLAFILFFIGEIEKLFEVIEEINRLVSECSLSEEKKNAVLGETELLISFTAFNDIAEMSRHHQKAFELLGGRASLINMRSTWTFGSPSIMCLYHRNAGKLENELKLMDECMPRYYALTGGHGNGAEFAMRAEAEFMRGRLEEAEKAAHRAAFEAQSKNQSSVYQCALFVLANVAVQHCDEAKLFDTLFSMSENAASNEEDMCRYTLDLFLGYIYAFTHRAEMVSTWLAEGDITENRLAPMTVPFAQIVYAKILFERREYIKLLAFCQFARKRAEALCSILPQIYFYVFECCANVASGNASDAEQALNNALALLGGDKIYMPFAQSFSTIKPILKKLAEKELYCEAERLGIAFEKAAEQIGTVRTRLSHREREVAELIRQGLTNKQIASRLFISLSTVKMTISNIFDKTGVRSRAQLADMIKK